MGEGGGGSRGKGEGERREGDMEGSLGTQDEARQCTLLINHQTRGAGEGRESGGRQCVNSCHSISPPFISKTQRNEKYAR